MFFLVNLKIMVVKNNKWTSVSYMQSLKNEIRSLHQIITRYYCLFNPFSFFRCTAQGLENYSKMKELLVKFLALYVQEHRVVISVAFCW